VFDPEESIAEKLNAPSSVFIKKRNDISDRVYVRVREDFDVGTDGLKTLLQRARRAFPYD